MGRVKTQIVKRATAKLIERHRAYFKDSFKDNKEILSKLTNIPSAKLKNIIAGYITRQIKSKD